jgi:two-component system, chemotaxis family, sensor kinase CheA
MNGLPDEPADDFVSRFLDDYFAECEEHLAVVRRALLALESAMGDAAAEATLLDELFRSYHSLKGISAMVDVREAERLAHELEGYLRRLRDRELTLASDSVTVLIDSTAVLESVIAARRRASPPPSIQAAVDRLVSLTRRPPVGASVPGAAPAEEREAGAGAARWRFTFVPSPALVERGIKVDSVRSRLAAIGRIASVSPQVTPGGGITFEFIVTGPTDPSAFEAWRQDGLSWERIETDPAEAEDASHASSVSAAPRTLPDTGILAPSHFVRVDLHRLDEVMRRVADLVITRARLEENLAGVERLVPAQDWRLLQENTLTMERQLRHLREDVMRVRLVPVDEIFRRMPFVARDVAREAGKDVRVVLSGQDTEIDKFLVERMMDPVLHLVRNAVSHGIEPAERRTAAGKAAQGTVTLRASTSGEMILLEIADDGAGIDTASVADRARAAGGRVPEGPLDARTVLELICEPGFSTREEPDRASGRGMGMSVVWKTVHELGGSMMLDTMVGRGTSFVISLPLTLAITDALIATASSQRFAVPQSSVQEVIEVEEAAVRRIENNELIPYRGQSLPLVRLRSLFALGADGSARFHAFVIGRGQDAVALAVDRILGQREIVVRTMSDALLKVDGITGATELGDGRVVLILDAAALSRQARSGSGRYRPPVHRAGAPALSAPDSVAGGLT